MAGAESLLRFLKRDVVGLDTLYPVAIPLRQMLAKLQVFSRLASSCLANA